MSKRLFERSDERSFPTRSTAHHIRAKNSSQPAVTPAEITGAVSKLVAPGGGIATARVTARKYAPSTEEQIFQLLMFALKF